MRRVSRHIRVLGSQTVRLCVMPRALHFPQINTQLGRWGPWAPGLCLSASRLIGHRRLIGLR